MPRRCRRPLREKPSRPAAVSDTKSARLTFKCEIGGSGDVFGIFRISPCTFVTCKVFSDLTCERNDIKFSQGV